jgi:uncharacterized protein (TIGR02996 family)
MTDEGFLRDILDHLEDDSPRLIYADWLEEHGRTEHEKARAEFIRLQIELARGKVKLRRRIELSQRQDELLRDHELAWVGPLAELVQRARFVRGFVERVTILAEDFLQHGARLFDLMPLRHVILTEESQALPQLVKSPLLRRLATLEIRTGPEAEGVRLLAGSEQLAQLTGLVLQFSPMGDEGAELIARSPHLKRLTLLDLYESALEVSGVRALARSANLAGLTTLVLGGACQTGEGDPWVEPLVGTGGQIGQLTHLHLSFNSIGDAGARALAQFSCLANLTTLDLKHNQIGTEGAIALANSQHLRKLRTLELRGNPLDEEAQAALKRRFGKRVHC